MTVPMLLDAFEEGRTVQYSHTVIEGSNWREAIARVAADDTLEHALAPEVLDDALQASDADGAAIMTAIGHPELHPEGQFFADTYRFPRGTSDVEYLARAKATLDAVLAEEWAERQEGLPLESPYEALILASIIEKETAVPAERPLIAGVFVARLEKGHAAADRPDRHLRGSVRASTATSERAISGPTRRTTPTPGRASRRRRSRWSDARRSARH